MEPLLQTSTQAPQRVHSAFSMIPSLTIAICSAHKERGKKQEKKHHEAPVDNTPRACLNDENRRKKIKDCRECKKSNQDQRLSYLLPLPAHINSPLQ
jgi:hypothetical protein